ncbi:MAG: holo-ACP synthase [Anaerolineales bacterium]|nr:holo-ACP synthase [Anaerolineales bacterium]
MMLFIRTGIDLIEIERIQRAIQRHGKRFLERVYTPGELAVCGQDAVCLAGRFAAKEAVSKALGTGIGPVVWREMEILCGPAGEPVLRLHGKAQVIAAALKLTAWSVSISDTHTQAAAVAVALGDSTPLGN